MKPELTIEERETFRALRQSPAFRLALLLVEEEKPSVFTAVDTGSDNACAHRLHEIRGWERFRAALLAVGEPRLVMTPPEHDFAPQGGEA